MRGFTFLSDSTEFFVAIKLYANIYDDFNLRIGSVPLEFVFQMEYISSVNLVKRPLIGRAVILLSKATFQYDFKVFFTFVSFVVRIGHDQSILNICYFWSVVRNREIEKKMVCTKAECIPFNWRKWNQLSTNWYISLSMEKKRARQPIQCNAMRCITYTMDACWITNLLRKLSRTTTFNRADKCSHIRARNALFIHFFHRIFKTRNIIKVLI